MPIDWVARTSVALGRDPRARGRTFHLVDPRPLSARRVFEPRGEGRAGRLRAARVDPRQPREGPAAGPPASDRIAKSPRAFLETLTTPVTYDARNTSELLASLDLPSCPPIESYVEKLVEYVQERGAAATGLEGVSPRQT